MGDAAADGTHVAYLHVADVAGGFGEQRAARANHRRGFDFVVRYHGADPAKAVANLGQDQEANSDLYASGDYRRHLARVHAVRALTTAIARAS